MDKHDIKIGQNIKLLRTSQRITLKELSDSTGLSISYLSQVERGHTSIAINSLTKIAEAMGKDVSFFLELPIKYIEAIKRSHEHEIICDDSGVFYEADLTNKQDCELLRSRLITMLPSQTHCAFEHAGKNGEAFYYVLEGVATVILGSEEYILYPGDSIHHNMSVPHEIVNRTSMLTKIVFVSAISDVTKAKR